MAEAEAEAEVTDTGARATAGRATARRPGSRTAGAWASARGVWARLPESLREALLPYAVARGVVLGALGMAHFIVDRTHPAAPGVAARVHAGLLSWDAGWYETIARVGYGALGRQSLRFFPAVPLLTHALAWFPGLGDGPALVLLANVAALAATAMLYVLVRRETGQAAVARRAVWVLSLLPSAFVLVLGYAESLLLVLAIGCFLALRPPPPSPSPLPAGSSDGPGDGPSDGPSEGPSDGPRDGMVAPVNRPHFAVAGVLAFAAALTRPIGVLLFLAVAAEVIRWWPRLGREERVAGIGAVAAPFVGLVAFLAWAKHTVNDWWAPLRVQLQTSHHGGLADPFATLYDDAKGLAHHHVGTALHVPWVLLALAMLLVCWRRLPAPYTLFAAAELATGVSGANLDSFERYALGAFPLSIAAALLLTESQIERVVLTLLSAGLAAYALLAYLNISVP